MKQNPDRHVLLNMYKNLELSRLYEEKLIELFSEGKIPGWIHSGLGQEATGVAIGECLTEKDYLVPYFRSRSSLIAKGMDLKKLTAEIFGRSTGCCQGRSGEPHLADVSRGILGAGGIIGSPIPIAVGLAYAARLEGKGRVVVCGFGDGSTNRGAFHESINMASVMDLPVIFVCENNQYTEFTPTSQEMRIKDIFKRAEGYGIPGEVVDGNDPMAVYEVLSQAVDRARNGDGPTLIEAKTYRIRGHFEGDPCEYRPAQELEMWKRKDPFVHYQNQLKDMKIIDAKIMEETAGRAKQIIDEAVHFAMESPLPTREEIIGQVYA